MCMKQSKQAWLMIAAVTFCALVMSIVDGVIQPGYAVKSVIKVILFLIVPLCYFLRYPSERSQFRALFRPKGRDIATAFALGVPVYALIVGGYFLITLFVDLTAVILKLTADGGVSAENFVFVSLYISFVNSLLEEFLFRGFAFITLKTHTTRRFAYLFSAAVFACYHFGMIAGTVNIPVWIAAMAGLFVAGLVLDYLNERSGNIYVSWLVHMFANFGINTVGFVVFGMI